MSEYLEQVRSIYYFRRVVPLDLRSAFLTNTGKARVEWKWSLATKDRAEAKRRNTLRTLETDGLIEAARRRAAINRATSEGSHLSDEPGPTLRDAARAAREEAAFHHMLATSEQYARELSDKDARREELTEAIEALKLRLRGSTREMSPEMRAVAYLLEEQQFDAALLKDRVTILGAERHAIDGLSSHIATEAPKASSAIISSSLMLDTEIVDKWAAERCPSQKTKDAHKAAARWFYERVGKKPVADIERKDVLAFKNALLAEGQTPTNINVKIARLKTLLQWAVNNDHAAINATTGITLIDSAATKNRRKPYDLASLNAIFASPVYAQHERPARGRGEAAYWMPILALFTGARLEELAQLNVADVRAIEYPDADGTMRSGHFLHLIEDDDDVGEERKKLKNAGSERLVPIHEALKQLGFLQYVEMQAEDGRLFPELRAGAYGRFGAKWGEWFSSYRRGICKIADRRLTFHSFRHTFKDYLRSCAVEEGVQRQLMGHVGGDAAASYGTGYPLHRLVTAMAQYKVAGLNLPQPPY